jgi:hypothetical protein
MHPATTMPVSPTPARPTSTALEAAQALQSLVESVVPVDERPALRARLHVAAQALQRALDAGASIHEVVTALVTATAPPVEAPPFEPWRSVLGLSFDEFAESGVGLHVRLPKLAEAVWFASDAGVQAVLVRETKLWIRYIKLVRWMIEEADRLRLPTAERTVGGLITGLDGVVDAWRAPEAR